MTMPIDTDRDATLRILAILREVPQPERFTVLAIVCNALIQTGGTLEPRANLKKT